MKYLCLFLLILASKINLNADSSSFPAESVAILYNSNLPESQELAEYYAKSRNIPITQLIGLSTSKEGKISRDEYVKTIQNPLRKYFTDKGWWKLQPTSDGFKVAGANKIRLLVCMYGVPFGIDQDTTIKVPENVKANPSLTKLNCSSVDSELTILSVHDFPPYLVHQNQYFKKDEPFKETPFPFYMLVGRIDAPSAEICKRMIDDAIAVEKTGLYGMCYLDHAKKGAGYQLADDWLTRIEQKSWVEGIPTTVEKTPDTYLSNYPMRDVAIYFGWYAAHRNGPLLNPEFKFKKGAVAVHLHSFSATMLRNKEYYWVGAILNAGAAATVGNVYEPYLAGTHYFDILYDRLLKGYTLAEAASMSMPLLSWQGVVLGDPLYRPFLANKKKPLAQLESDDDLFYREIKQGLQKWQHDEGLLSRKFRTAAQKTKDGRYYEITGLLKRSKGNDKEASLFFSSAEKLYLADADKARIKLHQIDMLREQGKKSQAILATRALYREMKGTPEEATAQSLLNILSPPPPPKAKANKQVP